MGSCTGYVTMAESNSPPAIPDKSRSLRKTSVKKRLETEVKRKEPKSMKDRLSKKARLSKYRRKSANAKERERMKRQNDVFEVLKEILPCDKAKRSADEEKETKVTTLRSAIAYINSLQSLLDDCEAGRLDSSLVRHCSLSSATTGTSRKKKRSQGGKRKSGQAGLKEKMEPKWTHYSKQDLRTKFEPKLGVIEASAATTIGLLPASVSVPPFTLATPSPPQATTATYQLPTTILRGPSSTGSTGAATRGKSDGLLLHQFIRRCIFLAHGFLRQLNPGCCTKFWRCHGVPVHQPAHHLPLPRAHHPRHHQQLQQHQTHGRALLQPPELHLRHNNQPELDLHRGRGGRLLPKLVLLLLLPGALLAQGRQRD